MDSPDEMAEQEHGPVTRLVQVNYRIKRPVLFPVGMTLQIFQDPETGKCYQPKDGYKVMGDDLTDLFFEVPNPEEQIRRFGWFSLDEVEKLEQGRTKIPFRELRLWMRGLLRG